MSDNRTPIEPNTEFVIKEIGGNEHHVIINKLIARGGSCLVYSGYKEIAGNERLDLIIKEFYPADLSLKRSEKLGELVVAQGDVVAFLAVKDRFNAGIKNHLRILADNRDIVAPAMEFKGPVTDTENSFFVGFRKSAGARVLSEYNPGELSIVAVIDIAISLCDAIQYIDSGAWDRRHGKYLYLDTKPENVLVQKSILGGQEAFRVALFDFDSLWEIGSSKDEVRCTREYAAPEQLNNGELGPETDIYGIVGVLFYLLCGKPPKSDNVDAMEFSFVKEEDWGSDKYKAFVRELKSLLRQGLSDAPTRYDIFKYKEKKGPEVNVLKDRLSQLVNMLRTDFELRRIDDRVTAIEERGRNREHFRPIADTQFSYCAESTDFSGRETELEYLKKFCKECNASFSWTGIGGDGGSGKTRLVYELCQKLEKDDWNVYYPAGAETNIEVFKKDCEYGIDKDTLICFDDAVVDLQLIKRFIESYVSRPASKRKVRLILVDRYIGDFSLRFSGVNNYKYDVQADGVEDGFLIIKKLEKPEITAIMASYAKKVFDISISDNYLDMLYTELQKIDEEVRPLFALFVCDAWCEGKDIRHWKQKEALESVKNKEFGRITKFIEDKYKYEEEKHELIFDQVRSVIFFLTIFGNRALKKWEAMLTQVDGLGFSADEPFKFLLKNKLGLLENDKLTKIYPDILGEYISIDYFNKLERKVAFNIVELLLKDSNNWQKLYNFSKNISIDFRDILIKPTNMSTFQIIAMEVDWRAHQSFILHQNSWLNVRSEEVLGEFDLYWKYDYLIDKREFDFRYPKDKEPQIPKGWFISLGSTRASWKLFSRGDIGSVVDSFNEEGEDAYAELLTKAFIKSFEVLAASSIYEVKKVKSSLTPLLPGYEGEYEGEMVLGNRCGKGKYVSQDCMISYEGEWNVDQPNGAGELQCGSQTYKGQFAEGERHGEGILKMDDGRILDAHWKYDDAVGRGTFTDTDGTMYEGEWVREGNQGLLKLDSGDKICAIIYPYPSRRS